MDQQQKKQTPSKSQIMYDPMIIPRVKQYLEENVHQRYLDVGVMSRMLQERYREYSRRKSAPFRQLVEQAYKTVLHSYGLDSNPSSDDNDEVGSDLEVMEERPDLMNSMLTSLYTDNRTPAGAAAAPAAGPAVVQDSIDISSDDDDDDNKADSSSKASKTATVAKNAAAAADSAENAPKKSSNKSASGGSVQRHGNTIITVVPAAQTVDGDSPAVAGAVADGTTPVAGLASPVPKKRKTHHVDELNAKLNAALPYAEVRMQEMMQAYNTLTNDSLLNVGKKAGLLGAKPRRPSSSNAIAGSAPPPSAVNGGPAVLANATNASAARSTARKYKREFLVQDSTYNFDDVGGLERILMELCELLLHIKHPEVYRHIGLPPPRGFLLHGPPGCGKTLLAQAIAGQLDVCMIQVAATELVAGVSGESEERIRELFEQAAAVAPCVLFIDEIDAISSNRQHAQKDMERRIVAQLLSCLDGLSKHPHGDQVLIIGATNRADTLDPALRRVGRFDQEISLGIPDRHAREHILRVICTNLKLTQPFDYDWIAALTPGYVGADLLALATRAASIAVKRAFSAKADLELRQIGARREANLAREAAKLRALYGPNEALQTVNLLDDSAMEEGPVEESVGEKTVADVIAVEPEVAVNGEQVATEVAEKSQEDVEPQVVVEPVADVEPVVTDVAPVADVEPMDTDKTVDVQPMDTDKAAEVEKEQSAESTDNAAVTNTEENKDTEKTETEDNGSNKTADEAKSPDNDVVDKVPEIAEPETTPVAEVAEQITPAPATAEVAATIEPTATEPAVEAAVPQPTAAPPAAAAVVDEIVDLSDDETLSEALLKNPTVRLSLTLDEMVGWLSATDPIIDSEEIRDLAITMADFCEAVKLVQPSAKREGFITVPDVTWDDIGALRDIREELQLAVLAPVRYPQKLEALGLKSPSGVLLCGPPGCGKTLLAKAVANEAGINFISVKGPELLNMYVGESERAVRQCFQRARNSAPCVIFFDEFDALCPTRSGSSENTSSSRVVNQLLTEMDGVEERKGVFLMAATNRPDIVDPAVLRPGRLDKILYVGLPGERERAEILEALTKTKPKLGNDVSYTELAALTENFTGADLAGLVRQASLQALKDSIADALAQPDGPGQKKAVVADDQTDPIRVHRANFVRALTHIRPSVSEEDKRHYLRLQKKYTVMPATPPEV